MTKYMKANIAVNEFLTGNGKFIGAYRDAFLFKDMGQARRIIQEMKDNSLDKKNIKLDVIIESIENA